MLICIDIHQYRSYVAMGDGEKKLQDHRIVSIEKHVNPSFPLLETQQPCFYPPSDLSIFYSQPQQGPIPGREPQRCNYEPSRAQTYHLESKLTDHYALRPPPNSHGHIIHGGALAINSQAPPKTGSIATGYPVRSQTQYQQVPTAAPALYTAQNRPLYQSPGTPMSYTQRE